MVEWNRKFCWCLLSAIFRAFLVLLSGLCRYQWFFGSQGFLWWDINQRMKKRCQRGDDPPCLEVYLFFLNVNFSSNKTYASTLLKGMNLDKTQKVAFSHFQRERFFWPNFGFNFLIHHFFSDWQLQTDQVKRPVIPPISETFKTHVGQQSLVI